MENRADKLLQAFLVEISQVRRYSPQTVRAYQADLGLFQEFCGPLFEQKVEKIARAELIGRFLAENRRTGVSARTVARRASALRSFFRFLARQGLLSGDVSDLFPSIKLPRTIPRYLTAKTMRAWIDAMPEKTLWDTRDKALVLSFYGSGGRLSEIAGLKWEDFEGSARQLTLLGKRNKQRVVPIGDVAAGALEKYKNRLTGKFGVTAVSPASPVFVNQRGGPLHSRSISRILNKHFATVSGGSTVHPHLLRHTFATHLMNLGADVMAVKELLGHESANTTQIYTHVSGEHLKKMYNRAFPRAEGDGE